MGKLPSTPVGVLVAIGLFALLVLFVYADGLAVLLGVVLVVLVLASVYYVGYRADKYLKNELG